MEKKEENINEKLSRKIAIKETDMKEEMKNDAIDLANKALDKNTLEREIAKYIKLEFDKKYGTNWHCIGIIN
jgi:dynein light chain LC8-type